jgi:hypothetical protein
MVEHSLGEIKKERWHKTFGEDMPKEVLDLIEQYRKKGQRTAPCSNLLRKQEVLEMAAAGDAAALRWCKYNQWVPLSKQGCAPPLSPPPFSVAAAQQQHVIAGLSAAMSFRGISSPEWRLLFQQISGNQYVPPERAKVRSILEACLSTF